MTASPRSHLMQTLQRALARPAAPPPIGVDFAAERLNMLQMQPARPGERYHDVRAAVSLAYPVARAELLADPARLGRFVRMALAQAPFSGRRVYAALAPADVRILPMTVQLAAGQAEAQAVARAARDQLGMAAADAVVDYYQIRSADSDQSERQVLVAVAQQAQVVAYLDRLRGAGMDPVALDIGPAAIARLMITMQREDLSQAILLINFGVSKSFLTVIWGRRLMLDREIDFGAQQLTDKLGATLGLSSAVALDLIRAYGFGAGLAERVLAEPTGQPDVASTIREILHPEFAVLAEELARTQVYIASRTRGSTLSRVYLNGSLARYPNIRHRISELVPIPVAILNPLDGFASAPELGADVQQGIALAAGLALRGEPRG